MAMTPEARVKKKVVAILKAYECYYFYPVTGGYGRSGVPDIIVCYKGAFIGIECKAGKGKTTPLQDLNINQIRDAGGVAIVVNEDNLDDVKQVMQGVDNS